MPLQSRRSSHAGLVRAVAATVAELGIRVLPPCRARTCWRWVPRETGIPPELLTRARLWFVREVRNLVRAHGAHWPAAKDWLATTCEPNRAS